MIRRILGSVVGLVLAVIMILGGTAGIASSYRDIKRYFKLRKM